MIARAAAGARLAVYFASAVAITWPLALAPMSTVVGGVRTDAYNSLWTYWFVATGLARGEFPLRTTLLDFPEGGRLIVADPLNAALATPMTLAFGCVFAYAIMVLLQLTLAGVFADALGRRFGGRGWIAGIAYPWSAVVLAHLQNGSSEATGVAWLPLAGLLAIRFLDAPTPPRFLGAALALAATGLGGGWYAGIDAFLLVGAFAAFLPGGRRLWPVILVAALLDAPLAYAFRSAAEASDGLLDIKVAQDLERLRRTIGAADLRSAWVPGDFRAPDFTRFEENASDLVHTIYLGWALLALAVWKGRSKAVWAAGIAAFVLAHGPVVILYGEPVAIAGRALPLPYALVEAMPGFGSLSLLFRIATLCPLALGLLADRAHPGFALAIILETSMLGPARTLPAVSPAPVAAPLFALAEAGDGAVVSLPAGFTRTRLFEQTAHHHPLTASINSGINAAGLRVLADLRSVEKDGTPYAEVSAKARALGVRYVVIHPQEAIESTFAPAIRVLKGNAESLPSTMEVRVYALW